MTRTVDEAFAQLLGWLTPSDTETSAASSHRGSIESALKSSHGMTNFFRSGSFGFGTSVSGNSDVDYFSVVPPAKLHKNSTDSLASFYSVLDKRFPKTGVNTDAPAIVVPFGTSPGERHEIIPAYHIRTLQNGDRIFGIPDRVGGWMYSSPDAHGRWVNGINSKFSGKVKSLIRLMKAWKYYSKTPIRSFYLEACTAEYSRTQVAIISKYDVRGVLGYLKTNALANMSDPAGVEGVLYAGFNSEIVPALKSIGTAYDAANEALLEESSGRIASAFECWDKVFAGNFPGYY